MRRLTNNVGTAFIPFLLGVGLVWGVALMVAKDNWQPLETKEVHYQLIKEEPTESLWEVFPPSKKKRKVIFDWKVPIPIPQPVDGDEEESLYLP